MSEKEAIAIASQFLLQEGRQYGPVRRVSRMDDNLFNKNMGPHFVWIVDFEDVDPENLCIPNGYMIKIDERMRRPSIVEQL